jgi:membrane protein required for colicin V production
MTPLDYFVVLVAGVSFFLGFWRGFVKSAISFASTICGLIAAAYLYPYAGKAVGVFVSHPVADFIGFVGIFVLILLAGALLSRTLRYALRRAHLGWADRILGGAFGLLRAWIICSAVYLALTAFPFRIDAVEKAEFSPVLLQGTRVIAYVTSSEMRARFLSGYASVASAEHRPHDADRRR